MTILKHGMHTSIVKRDTPRLFRIVWCWRPDIHHAAETLTAQFYMQDKSVTQLFVQRILDITTLFWLRQKKLTKHLNKTFYQRINLSAETTKSQHSDAKSYTPKQGLKVSGDRHRCLHWNWSADCHFVNHVKVQEIILCLPLCCLPKHLNLMVARHEHLALAHCDALWSYSCIMACFITFPLPQKRAVLSKH